MKPFFLMLFMSACVFAAHALDRNVIQLKQEHIGYAPKSFYISDVVDDREGNTAIGTISGGGGKEKLTFQNDAATSLKSFIEQHVTQDKTTQAIVLHISKMDIDVRTTGETRQVNAAMAFIFYAAGKKVLELSGEGEGQMDEDAADYIESFIRKTIENNLKRFDNWWMENRGKIATQSTVKANVTIGRSTDKPNCIVYSLQRPLSIADFTGPVEGDVPELAATFSGIGMGYGGKTENGQVVLNVTITPYFDRSQSWFKEAGKNPRVLAHEQAHFDITAIKACELAETIRHTPFTQENYEQLMQQLQKQNAKDANEEESTYDNETNHGIIEDKQIEWQNRLSQKVRETGCY
jgi:hypothetical protein